MATQSRGAPYPLGTDANNTAADIQALSLWVNERPGVTPVTTTQRNAMTGIELWDGRVVLNTTLDKFQRYDSGLVTWVSIADESQVAALLATTGTPAAIGTASRGVSGAAARADHVHPDPPYQSYTPTWTASSTALSLGNGTLVGTYADTGRHIDYRIELTIGNTTNPGTGFWTFGLPVAMSAGVGRRPLGDCGIQRSGIGPQAAFPIAEGSANLVLLTSGNAAVGNGTPFSPVAGDTYCIAGRYQRS